MPNMSTLFKDFDAVVVFDTETSGLDQSIFFDANVA
jgi:uncharacterized protein YprB with RNaseH-like and TPR domain